MADTAPAWVFSDGHSGNLKQALALSRLLGLSAKAKQVTLTGLDRWLAPTLKAANPDRVLLDQGETLRHWLGAHQAALAIGCGRVAAAALRSLKTLRPDCQTIQILAPGCSPDYFDAVVCPQHDRLRAPNVLNTLGAIHTLELDLPAQSNQSQALLLLIGNPTRHAPWTANQLHALLAQIQNWDGPIWISLSRRSDPEIQRSLHTHPVAEHPRTELFPPLQDAALAAENPYMRWLTQARQIVVTPDSVNMLSEAVATRANVYAPWRSTLSGKLARFHTAIDARVEQSPLTLSACSTQAPLADTQALVQRLRSLLESR